MDTRARRPPGSGRRHHPSKDQLGFNPESPRRQARMMVLLLSPFIALRLLFFVSLSNGSQEAAWIWFAIGVPLVMLWCYIRIRMGWTMRYWNPLSWWAGGKVADSMNQWPTKAGQPPAPVGPLRRPTAGTLGDPSARADGSHVETASAAYLDTRFPPRDWHDLVLSISARLEEALGEGFSVEPAGFSVVLRYGTVTATVPLMGALETPPLAEGPRAVRACRKMMHDTEQFAQRVLGHSWPEGPQLHNRFGTGLDTDADAAALGPAARAETAALVELANGEISLAYVNADGALLLQLRPIPFPG